MTKYLIIVAVLAYAGLIGFGGYEKLRVDRAEARLDAAQSEIRAMQVQYEADIHECRETVTSISLQWQTAAQAEDAAQDRAKQIMAVLEKRERDNASTVATLQQELARKPSTEALSGICAQADASLRQLMDDSVRDDQP